ncbi:GNAT family N-acetyltransferase [Lusitaniella coriacea]|uniref:GNAT family N-acetyltransferase n=1 Tax=Lusitaniella coriacea TaxID=1983105 RepID=UPI003CF87709
MYIIRKYKDTDLDDVLLSWENASKIAHPFLKEDFLVQERKNIPELYLPNADTWVVDADNQVVGFIALLGNEVGAIFLQPKYHGKKIGKLMMDKAQELHGNLEVEVFEKNSIGRNFYAKYGFKLIEKKIHKQTGERLLRLKFIANK